MNYRETLEWIHSTERFGSRLGMERMEEMLRRFGDPHKKMHCIHVAGTNGKGSTTTMIASALTAAGYRTGKFISPYILEFRERMQVNGEMIPEERLAALATALRPISDELAAAGDPPTEFELVTVLGFLWFAEVGCDVAVLEVGMGGRLDSTNVIPAPLVSVITRIDYDHTAILGDTLSAIAFEKCGILKRGSKTVCYPDQAEEALAMIRRRAEEEGISLILPEVEQLSVLSADLSGSRIRYRGQEYFIPLAGEHQTLNAITALEAIAALQGTPCEVPAAAAVKGIADAHFPARLEVLRTEPPVLLDGAHNPNGGDALCRSLQVLGQRDLTAVVGMLRDKDCLPVLKMMAPYCRRMIATTVANPRTNTAEELGGLLKQVCGDVAVIPNCEEALRHALTVAEGGVLVFGSLYLAAEARPILQALCREEQ